MEDVPNRIWKERPPGPEQLLLEEMFENGSIAAYATPETVRQSSNLFMAFPTRIFAAHLRKTKARMGEFIVTAKGLPGGVIPPSPKKSIGKIPELGSIVSQPTVKRLCSEKLDALEAAGIANPPYTLWTYTDHETHTDFVCLAINIFSGSKNMNFDISEDGLKIFVKFSWPMAMYNPEMMFENGLKDKTISKQHPMLHAMSSAVLKSGITLNSTPEGMWTIALPCKVRREVTSYKMLKIECGTTKIMFMEFTAYQNDVIIEHANRSLTFD